jgi:copper(I)-binding protein
MKTEFRILLAAGGLLVGTASAAFAADQQTAHDSVPANASAGVRVADGWVRGMPGGAPSAGYLTLHNDSDRKVTITGVASPDFAMVHLHESYTGNDGNSRMRMVSRLEVPAHGEVRLAPGGYHLMLMQSKRPLKPGDTVTIQFRFDDGATLSIPLTVKPVTYNGT